MTVFVDSNVLVYAADSSQPDKHDRARAWLGYLWERRAGRLSAQVLREYYVTVTRKLSRPMDPMHARADVRDLMAWEVATSEGSEIEDAWAIEDRFRFSFWDALIVAAARSAGCRHLLTEDLQDGQDLDGLLVVDPFAHEPSLLGER